MKEELREKPRIAFRKIVTFGPYKQDEYTCLSSDLSTSGLCMETHWAFEPGTTLNLYIDGRDKRYKAEGTVVWSKKHSPGVVQTETALMGVKFSHVDKKLMDDCKPQFRAMRRSAVQRFLGTFRS